MATATESKHDHPTKRSSSKPKEFSFEALNALLGTPLPLSADGKPLIRPSRRATPHGTFWNLGVVPTKHGRVIRHGPSDATFADFPTIQSLVPRIFVVAELPDGSYDTVIRELPKFGAFSPGDADEVGATSCEIHTKDLAHPDLVTIRAEEKANGHTVVYRIWNGLLVGGTKGCAWAIPCNPSTLLDEIEEAKSRFPTLMVHDAFVEIGKLIVANPSLVTLLESKALVGERETNQHIRYYPKPGLVFFDQDLPSYLPKPLIGPPITLDDLDNPSTILSLRSGPNHEGWVLVGVAKDGSILWRLKLKAISYTVERSLRELFREDDGLAITLLKCKRVILQRNLAFLHVSLDYLLTRVFEGFLSPLIHYLYSKGVTKDTISFAAEDGGFACVIQAFREESGLNDDFCPAVPLSSADVDRSALILEDISHELSALQAQRAVVTTSRFFPGCGKSTWMALVETLLGTARSQTLSQDDFGGSKPEFVKGVNAVLRTKTALVARCNFGSGDRKTLIDAAAYRPILFLEPSPEDDPVLLIYASLKGLVEDRPDHPTLGTTPLAKRLNILGSFFGASRPIAPYEAASNPHCEAMPLSIIVPGAGLDGPIYDAVKAFMTIYQGRKPFSVKRLPEDFDAEAFAAMVRGGPELRRPPADIAAAIHAAYLDFSSRSSTPILYASVDLVERAGKASPPLAALDASGLLSSKATQVSADHVTIVFKPSLEAATSLYHLEGVVVRGVGSKIYVAPDGSIGALAVDDLVYTMVGTETRSLEVASGCPHITLAWDPSKRSPKESVDLIEGSLGEPTAIDLAAPFFFEGVVTFHHTLRI